MQTLGVKRVLLGNTVCLIIEFSVFTITNFLFRSLTDKERRRLIQEYYVQIPCVQGIVL